VNLADISTQLLYTTLPIWVERIDGKQALGTSFILSVNVPGAEGQQVPLLITNNHVVAGAKRGLVELVERDGDTPKRGSRIRVEIPGETLLKHTDGTNDLAIVPLGGLLNELEAAGKPVFFRSISPEFVPTEEAIGNLAAMEEITFIGYPSGLYDQHNVSPIIRRGITATPPWNDFGGLPAFLIDAGVFPGSSGSPVFILNQGAYPTSTGLVVGNRLHFMGVLTEAILRKQSDTPEVFLGIGRVTKSKVVVDFATKLLRQLLPQ
jgi:hypothetical protein